MSFLRVLGHDGETGAGGVVPPICGVPASGSGSHPPLLRGLPYPNGERLVRVFGTIKARGITESPASLPDYFDWIRQSRSFEHIGGFVRWSYSVVGGDHPVRVWGGMVTANLFQALGRIRRWGGASCPRRAT